MPISKKVRFQILSRDRFTCLYCGRKPPEVILEVDHIQPKSKQGSDDPTNLLTSCRDCNNSKRDKVLNTTTLPDIKQEMVELEAKKEQLDLYYKYLKQISNFEEKNPFINLAVKAWERGSDGEYTLSDKGRSSIKKAFNSYPPEDVLKAIRIAWENERVQPDSKIKYVYGVLKQMKLEKENPEMAKQHAEKRQSRAILFDYWNKQPRGSGYLPAYTLDEWMKELDEEDIKYCMDEAQGMWSDLKESIQSQIEMRKWQREHEEDKNPFN